MTDLQWLLTNIGIGLALLVFCVWCYLDQKRVEAEEHRRYLKQVAMKTAMENRRMKR